MTGRRRYDLFEPWPDDDGDELLPAESTAWSAMIVVVAIVVFMVVVAALVILVRTAGYFDDRRNDSTPREGRARHVCRVVPVSASIDARERTIETLG